MILSNEREAELHRLYNGICGRLLRHRDVKKAEIEVIGDGKTFSPVRVLHIVFQRKDLVLRRLTVPIVPEYGWDRDKVSLYQTIMDEMAEENKVISTNYKVASRGRFDTASENAKGVAMAIVSNFHYRTGVKHNDGSMGEIKISPKEFNDLLCFLMEGEG